MPHRVSTTLRVPRRDSLFSADDDTAEVEADAFRRRLVNRRKSAPPGFVPSQHHHAAPSGILRLELTEAPDELPVQNDAEVESDAGSFTLKLRQQAINETHPFGIRLWKPALYQQDGPPDDDGSIPGQKVNLWSLLFNILWSTFFGWWLAVLAAVGGLVCMTCPTSGSREYGKVLCSLAGYLFYPFGKLVRLEDDEYLNQGRSIHEYEQWQNGSLYRGHVFFGPRQGPPTGQSTMFGRGQWNSGRVIFHIALYIFIIPPLFLVSIICWALVFTIPMAKTCMHLLRHLQLCPLALSFDSNAHSTPSNEGQESRVLLCTYSAVGFRYWRYSIGGNSIFLIDLMGIALIIIFNWLVLQKLLHINTFTLPPGLLFPASLLGIIPLAYFIGKAVASISAQSSMGVSAVVNAFFSTIFEVLFYCVALKQGKSRLVEGCIIGSIFAGVLFLPGLSMCFGALKRKTQRFNSKSAGVTSTMLLFAIIGVFSPTLFYAVYGTHVMRCRGCSYKPAQNLMVNSRSIASCRTCSISQELDLDGNLYFHVLRPFSYFCAALLLLAYVIGLLFTLRTHAAVIWASDAGDKKHLSPRRQSVITPLNQGRPTTPIGTPFESRRYSFSNRRGSTRPTTTVGSPRSPRGALSPLSLPLQRVEINITTLEIPPGNLTRGDCDILPDLPEEDDYRDRINRVSISSTDVRVSKTRASKENDWHSVPNWSRTKSLLILLGATIVYGILVNIMIEMVDSIRKEFHVDEKFVGLTIFALVPNTTEIWNAILFAVNGNIALSMEIGSAYVLQVCLLQIPALVFFSALFHSQPGPREDLRNYVFPLVFPQWDMVLVVICVFLLGYLYGEGKSNYFKGSILLLAYVVVVAGFYFSGPTLWFDGAADYLIQALVLWMGARRTAGGSLGTAMPDKSARSTRLDIEDDSCTGAIHQPRIYTLWVEKVTTRQLSQLHPFRKVFCANRAQRRGLFRLQCSGLEGKRGDARVAFEHVENRAFWRSWFRAKSWRMLQHVYSGFFLRRCLRMKLDGRDVLYRMSPQAPGHSQPDELVGDEMGNWSRVQGTVGDVDDDKDGDDEGNYEKPIKCARADAMAFVVFVAFRVLFGFSHGNCQRKGGRGVHDAWKSERGNEKVGTTGF